VTEEVKASLGRILGIGVESGRLESALADVTGCIVAFYSAKLGQALKPKAVVHELDSIIGRMEQLRDALLGTDGLRPVLDEMIANLTRERKSRKAILGVNRARWPLLSTVTLLWWCFLKHADKAAPSGAWSDFVELVLDLGRIPHPDRVADRRWGELIAPKNGEFVLRTI
jgi:hypothetical protein